MKPKKVYKVIIDFPAVNGSVNLACDNINFLHQFAKNIGIPKKFFVNKKESGLRYYIVKSDFIKDCILNGAVKVKRNELYSFLQSCYNSKPK